ncbi:MAG: branched-chain amino acid transport system II carrier protein [Firmicutes bacterium]|nr:branched-chain amino acid transport system II carrier protein [Bacillota bacterium]
MQKDKKKLLIDSGVIGAALFAMYFGAGNMIFPPFLGLWSRSEWFTGFAGYYLADIGLAVIAMFALIKAKGSRNLLGSIGRIPGEIIQFAIILCIGPVISIPRTAATTYELSIQSLNPSFNMTLFYVIFFVMITLLSINQSKVVDLVGKFLTPLLFIGLIFLIIKGVVDPRGVVPNIPGASNVIEAGIEAGYQTMDALASVIFGVLILGSAAQKGHTEQKEQAKVAIGASIVAGAGLLVVYLGLTYLGASLSGIYSTKINRTRLLIYLIKSVIPGQAGMIFFAVVAGLACVSTAIALTSSSAAYFSGLTKGKIGYKAFVIVIVVFSFFSSSMGVEALIKLAAPILGIVYPAVMALVITGFMHKFVGVWTCRMAVLSAICISVMETVLSYGINIKFVHSLPLAQYGFAWLLPAIGFGIIGFAIDKFVLKKIGIHAIEETSAEALPEA